MIKLYRNYIKKIFNYIPLWFITFWIIFFTIEAQMAIQPIFEAPFIYFFIIRIINLMLCGYILVQVLFPILVHRNKFIYYVILMIVLVLIQAKTQILLYTYFKLISYQYYTMKFSLPNTFFYFLMLTLLKFGMEYYVKKKEMAEENQRHTELELAFLKSQISPHFLFNTMNNLYGLSVVKSDKLPPLMLQLSDLLRYSLYETNQAFVPLEKEINYIKNYIDLEKIRIGDKLELSVNIYEANSSDVKIAPIILIIFVENAFKHSRTILNEKIKISFDLKVENNWIIFTAKNNFTEQEKVSNSGIGLENVKKRLEHLYPNQYALTIDTADNIYTSVTKLKVK